MLEDHADAAAGLAQPGARAAGEVDAVDRDRACGRGFESGQAADEGGLAGSGTPDDAVSPRPGPSGRSPPGRRCLRTPFAGRAVRSQAPPRVVGQCRRRWWAAGIWGWPDYGPVGPTIQDDTETHDPHRPLS